MKIAINGFGRIGRLVFRLMENTDLEVVAINDLTDAKQLAYLLKYDTNHGNYKIDDISYDDENIIIDGKKIRVYSETDPNKKAAITAIVKSAFSSNFNLNIDFNPLRNIL